MYVFMCVCMHVCVCVYVCVCALAVHTTEARLQDYKDSKAEADKHKNDMKVNQQTFYG